MKAHRRVRAWVWMGAVLVAAGGAGCNAEWHTTYCGDSHGYGSVAHVEGDGTAAAILLGVVGVAYLIEAIAEACRCH